MPPPPEPQPAEPIGNPLAWQAGRDLIPEPLNHFGFARFWATVEARLGRRIGTDGNPEFTELVIDLGDGVALRLWNEAIGEGEEGHTPRMQFAFVPTPEGLEGEAMPTFPDPHDEAAWERLAAEGEELARMEGIDLRALAERAEARVLQQIAEAPEPAEAVFERLWAHVRERGELRQVTHRMDNWAVDTWELGEFRAQLTDGGSTCSVTAAGLRVWRTYGRELNFAEGDEARLRAVAVEVLGC